MLTITHPHIVKFIKQSFFGGLLAIPEVVIDGMPVLIIKVSKEFILTAKIYKELRIFLVPVSVSGVSGLGLVTAVFDDPIYPLSIHTPIVDEEVGRDLIDILKYPKINVSFFDELGRECFISTAKISVSSKNLKFINNVSLSRVPEDAIHNLVMQVNNSFCSLENKLECDTIKVYLENKLVDDSEIVNIDLVEEHNTFIGSAGFHFSPVVREEPGQYQEQDIVQCLSYVFNSDEIIINPLRDYDNEEICDILVLTEKFVLIIQAKDSPNIESVINSSIEKKRKKTIKLIKKAASQVSGAIGYYDREDDFFDYVIGSQKVRVNKENKVVKSLIIVKELFYDETHDFSKIVLSKPRCFKSDCLLISYTDFYEFCFKFRDKNVFLNAIDNVMFEFKKQGFYDKVYFKDGFLSQ